MEITGPGVYRTRNGLRAEVVRIIPAASFPARGHFTDAEGFDIEETWRLDGRTYFGGPSYRDLVAVWEEPATPPPPTREPESEKHWMEMDTAADGRMSVYPAADDGFIAVALRGGGGVGAARLDLPQVERLIDHLTFLRDWMRSGQPAPPAAQPKKRGRQINID